MSIPGQTDDKQPHGPQRWDLDLAKHSLIGPSGPGRVDACTISTTGMRIDSDLPLIAGDWVEIELSNGASATARVVWSHDGSHGCEFDEPINVDAITEARLKNASMNSGHSNIQQIEPVGQRWAWKSRMRLIVVTSIILWAVIIAVALLNR